MEERNIYQCSRCGHIIINDKTGNYNKLFTTMYCPRCRDDTPHYYCGHDIIEFYQLYDSTLDERFYNYKKTEQND